MVKYVFKEFKTIINKMKYIDTWWYVRYTINGYRGCEHHCIYCDARSERYYLSKDFDQTIIVKKNVKEQLDRRLTRARTFLPDVTALGGVNDGYMLHTEKKFKNTRQILEVLLKHKYPVSISTKSILMLRDLDLFSKIAEETWCALAFTITSVDEEVSTFLEPRAASSEERFLALERIKQEYPAIQTGVNLLPIVPFLEDSDENLEAIVRSAHEVKVDNLTFGGLTLRDQASYFFQKLGTKYPDLVEKFHKLYQGGYVPKDKAYMLEINQKMVQLCKKYSVPYRIKRRYIPSDFRRVNYLVAQELADQAYERQIQGKYYNNHLWACNHIHNLTESITTIAARDELETIKNVKGKIKAEVEQLIKKYDKSKTLESYFK
ncbi:MAG: radical SAM protein [Candidatus Helarchaeota archaeon]|nr:radical SAM protein [Candidatus Helarchaeota archaeon]